MASLTDPEESVTTPAVLELHKRITQAYKQLSQAEGNSANGATFTLRDVQEKYHLWAGSLGLYDGPSQVQTKLAKSRTISLRIFELLIQLQHVLETGVSIFNPEDDVAVADQDQQARHYIRSSRADALEFDLENDDTVSLWITRYVPDLLQRLFKASTLLYTFGHRMQEIPAPEYTEDIAYVVKKYCGSMATPNLLLRLSRAISERRKGLDQLGSPLERQANDINVDTGSSSSDDELDNNTLDILLDDDSGVDWTEDPLSQHHEYPNANGIAPPMVPEPQPMLPSESGSVCPYCHLEQKFISSHSWKKHVYRDLRPYICMSDECPLLTFSSQAAWKRHEIDKHQRIWTCGWCIIGDEHSANFSSRLSLATHLQQQHGDSIADLPIDAFLDVWSCPKDEFSASDCSLCIQDSDSELWASSLWQTPHAKLSTDQFLDHLGSHLSELSLSAFAQSMPVQKLSQETVPRNRAAKGSLKNRAGFKDASNPEERATIDYEDEDIEPADRGRLRSRVSSVSSASSVEDDSRARRLDKRMEYEDIQTKKITLSRPRLTSISSYDSIDNPSLTKTRPEREMIVKSDFQRYDRDSERKRHCVIFDGRTSTYDNEVEIIGPHLQETVSRLNPHADLYTHKDRGSVKIDPRWLYHSLEGMSKALTEAESAKPSNDELQFELRAGIKFVRDEFQKELTTLTQLLPDNLITFDLLWTIFPPMCVVQGLDAFDHPEACLVIADQRNEVYDDRSSGKETGFVLLGEVLESDGKHIGWVRNRRLTITKFAGARKIMQLPFIPISLHEDAKGVRQKLIEAGRSALTLHGRRVVHYDGFTINYARNESTKVKYTGRVMLDPELLAVSGHDGGWVPRVQPINAVESSTLKEKDLMLMSTSVYGFNLESRVWTTISVYDCSSVQWDQSIYANLAFASSRKETLNSMFQQQKKAISGTHRHSSLHTKRLICVLSGPSGVGKTTTAKGITEKYEMPLLTIGAGEICDGTLWMSEFHQILSLAEQWHAVVLIEEAEILLSRSDNTRRNEVQAKFRRELENYRGIMILTITTTSDRFIIEPTFRSCVDIAIRYNDLDEAAREAIVQRMLKEMAKRERDVVIGEVDIHDLVTSKTNGWGLKRVLEMAETISRSKDKALDTSAIKEAMDLMHEITAPEWSLFDDHEQSSKQLINLPVEASIIAL